MFSEPVLIALIGLLGVSVTAGPNYLAHRKTRRQQVESIDAALSPVLERLDEIGRDLGEVKTRIAVHDDRWERPYLRPVAENRVVPEVHG
ncbi:MAG: hypothetical protein ABIQ18_06885 [Umezawaea sp.]